MVRNLGKVYRENYEQTWYSIYQFTNFLTFHTSDYHIVIYFLSIQRH